MSTQKIDWRSLFERKFRPAFREIEYLKGKIRLKEGFLIFRSHLYTIDELLKSEHHAKIASITEKIGDDTITWYKRGEMSQNGKLVYERSYIELAVVLACLAAASTFIKNAYDIYLKWKEEKNKRLKPDELKAEMKKEGLEPEEISEELQNDVYESVCKKLDQ